MFTTYRKEDDFRTAGVAERIAKFMSERSGTEVMPEDVCWEACVESFSMYSAIIKKGNDAKAIIVKKVGECLTEL